MLPGPWGAGTNLVSLGLVVWGVAAQGHLGLTGRHLAALVLLVVAVVAWLTWTGNRVWGWSRVSRVAWVVMGAAGGVLATYAALGVVFVAVAALAAALAWPPERAVLVAAVGPLATLLSAWGMGDQVLGITAGSTAAALGGLAMGIARRLAQERATQTALVQVSEARADAEEARAELLAGRNIWPESSTTSWPTPFRLYRSSSRPSTPSSRTGPNRLLRSATSWTGSGG